MSHVYFEYIFIWIIQHEKNTFPQLCCTWKTAKQHWLSFMSSRLSQIFPCTRPFQMHILTKKFKFYKFQKSDLILSEIGCTVINVYIPSKKMSLHFTWILNLYNSTKYEVACWVFFSFKFQHWSECGWKHLNLSNCFFTI